MITIERKVHFARGARSRESAYGSENVTSGGRVPRVSRLMALAIHLDRLIHDGVVADQADIARLGHVSRARLTQIMNLLQLAPDIQETLLFLPATARGRDVVTERDLRSITAASSWLAQRQMWQTYASRSEPETSSPQSL